MSRALLTGLSLACLLALAGDVRANGVPPPFRRGIEAKLVVQVDRNAKQPTLIIPSRFVGGGVPGKRSDAGNLNTAVAGLALAGAFVSGGLWLTRRRRHFVAAVAVLAFLGIGGGVLWADLLPPPGAGKVETVRLPANVRLTEKVTVRVVPAGDTITLILPTATAAGGGGGVGSAPKGAATPK